MPTYHAVYYYGQHSDRNQHPNGNGDADRDQHPDADRDGNTDGDGDYGYDLVERQQFVRNQLDAVLNDYAARGDLRDVADRLYDLGYQLHNLNINPIDGHKQLDALIVALGVEHRNLRAARDALRRDQHANAS